MKTSRPLRELIKDIILAWTEDTSCREIDWDLYEILNNKLIDHVKNSLSEEMISQRALNQTLRRIPAINVHKRVVDKTSKVYAREPLRLTNSESDKSLMKEIVDSMDLNKAMALSNRYLNSTYRFALEPYIDDQGAHKARVVAAHQFMPFSDSLVAPDKMTVYVKFICTQKDEKENEYDVLSLTSDDEFLIIDTRGAIRPDIMAEMGITSDINPFGRIPCVYGKTIDDLLFPFRNEEGKEMAILIPKLFADINFAAKYLTHSIIWSKNVKMEQVDVNADALWNLGESEDGKEPEVGAITPQVEIPNLLQAIASQVQNYFETVGIKTAVDMQGSNPVSAVSKAIDEADITDIRNEQISTYKKVEREFWELVSVMQSTWANRPNVKIKKKFSKDFIKSFTVLYPEIQVMQTTSQKLDESQKWLELKLASRKQMLKSLKPELSDEQIESWLEEVDDEVMEDMERKLEGLPGLRAEQSSNGQFTDGNQVAANAKPENNLRNET